MRNRKETLLLILALSLGAAIASPSFSEQGLNFNPSFGDSVDANIRSKRIQVQLFIQPSRIVISSSGVSYKLPLTAAYVFDDGADAGTRSVLPGQRITVTWVPQNGPLKIAEKITFERM